MLNQPTQTTTPPAHLTQNAFLLVTTLLLVDSLHFVFARLLSAYLPPVVSALYVLGVGTAETAVFLGIQGKIRPAIWRRHLRFFLAIGFLVATATTLNYTAVTFIDPGTAAMLAQTGTIFALGFGLFWLRERLSRIELVGALLAIVGVFIISFQPGDLLRLGSLFVLASTFTYALHAAVVKRYGGEIEFANFFLFRVASTTGFLLLFVVGRGQMQWPGWPAWGYLILAGSVDVVISRVLYYLALRRLQISFHAILLTLSPVVTILWSWALFGAWPVLQGVIGGTAVLAGVLVVTLSKRAQNRHKET
jgi:drug/metabolite transporter (DMT)-like permease